MKYLLIMIVLISTLFSSELNWSHDYEASLKVAEKENKDIYVIVTSTNCSWCEKFKNTTLLDKEVLKRLNEKYILVNIVREIDEMPENLNIKGTPVHYFLSSIGEKIYYLFGYMNSKDFISLLDDIE